MAAMPRDAPRRVHLLGQVEPLLAPSSVQVAGPVLGAVLALIGVYLLKRRRRAAQVTVALLTVACFLDLVKARELESAAATLAFCGLLWWGREEFCVRHDPLHRVAATWRLAVLWSAGFGAGALAVWAATGRDAGPRTVARETSGLLLWSGGPLVLPADFHWLVLALGAFGAATFVGTAAVIFRPLAVPQPGPDESARRAASELVRAHGHDTLAFFKLRSDTRLFFAEDGNAFAGYKISGSTLLLSGDPVGLDEAIPGLLEELRRFAERRGLVLGAVGASEELRRLYRTAGLRALYIGDEAIVETNSFSLEGRAIRKVRQSVNRLATAGFTTDMRSLGELDAATRADLERVTRFWRRGARERGFAMTLDGLACPHPADTTVAVARDIHGVPRAFVHLVPTYGRSATSLSLMCREPNTPNGLLEFLIVRTIEELRAQRVEELSLNFAAFARWIHHPRTRTERLLGRLAALGNPFFQIDGLYRFNAKFAPRWSPRYLLYERTLDLPRVALATMRVEGQLPARPRRVVRTSADGVEGTSTMTR